MIFDKATLAQLRKTQEASMMHECVIEPYIVADDGTVSYGKGVNSVCGFNANSGTVSAGTAYDSVDATAELRLPIGVAVGMKDRVTITAAFGQAVASKTYEVSGLPDSFGPSGQVVRLSEIWT